jgi:hypothetical protein
MLSNSGNTTMASNDEMAYQPEGTVSEDALKAAQVAFVSYNDLIDVAESTDMQ